MATQHISTADTFQTQVPDPYSSSRDVKLAASPVRNPRLRSRRGVIRRFATP